MNARGGAPVINLIGLHAVHAGVAAGVMRHQALAVFIGERLRHFQHQLVTQIFCGLQGRNLAAILVESKVMHMHFARALNIDFPGVGATFLIFDGVNEAMIPGR